MNHSHALFLALVLPLVLLSAPAQGQGLPLPAFRRAPSKRLGGPARRKPHPDAAFQRVLRAKAKRLARADTPGVELWVEIMTAAVDHYEGRDDLSVEQKFDRVMRDTGAVLVGEQTLVNGLESLRDYDRHWWLSVHSAHDPQVDWVLRQFRHMDDVSVGRALDSARGADFRPGFRDGSDGQIYHSFFYVLMSYFTGDPKTTGIGNLVHELRDPGGSAQDYDVGNWASLLGDWLRRFRDQGNEKAFRAIPTLFGAMFADDGLAYGDLGDEHGHDFRNLARTVDEMVTRNRRNPSGGVLGEVKHRVHRGAIGFMNWVKGD